ncbi:cytidylyltransferase domain-containing protein [Candidatus Epulonipiscium viviparus]|uniref:acylneuraminate cytidylyltransferase family protein n=1 Tax=Candidatus Epulonipiscium viviparus TaxID=420336 RepID=UPI00016C0478|nr:acylneuraminate cytidylyltransferase family protein [Candidatus Epulopiscium viviparus]
MEILGIIPARGGSKGLPGKNIKMLGDKPLIAYTIAAAINSKHITRTIVSTDDAAIAEVALKFGAEVPFMRPECLATDTATSAEVVLHLLKTLEGNGYMPDFICLLQCTSPFRTAADVDSCIEKCLNTGFDACYSVTEARSNPYWMKVFEGNQLNSFIDAEMILRRQDLPTVYELNGAIYFAKTEEVIKNKSLHLANATGYVMPIQKSVDIDTALEFELAKMLMNNI